MRKKKPDRRGRRKPDTQASERVKALKAARIESKRKLGETERRIKRTFDNRVRAVKKAVAHFKPRSRDKGTIVFVGTRGGRIQGASKRVGYAVYVNSKGRKTVVQSYNRKTGKLEFPVTSKKLTSIDVSRVRSKSARKKFLTQYLNPVARGELRKKGKGISQRGTRFTGNLTSNAFYKNADAVKVMAKELVKAVNGQRSKRDFLVTIGLTVQEGNGRIHFIQTQARMGRADSQDLTEAEAIAFFGQVIYAFLARELSMRGLVMEGSARHIGRLKQNRGLDRDEWTKDGFLWEGHDAENVKVTSVEYRFDHQTLA